MTRHEAIEKALRVAECYALGRRNFMRKNASAYDQSVIRDVEADVEIIQAALALPEDSKTVNSGLYNAMRDMADAYAFRVIQDIWPFGAALNASKISASNYLELREASGEPMPYKVVRDGDKVRFE